MRGMWNVSVPFPGSSGGISGSLQKPRSSEAPDESIKSLTHCIQDLGEFSNS